ncbi:MAG: VOC family protein [Steroidobacteraceae bacterium]
MVKTHGLTHISLAVRDLDRSLSFYSAVFGVREYFRDERQIQVQGPGPHDIIAFEKAEDTAGVVGGISHFGFRLTQPEDIGLAVAEAQKAGGRILRQGEFSPGFPYAYIADPDGYEIEVWYE